MPTSSAPLSHWLACIGSVVIASGYSSSTSTYMAGGAIQTSSGLRSAKCSSHAVDRIMVEGASSLMISIRCAFRCGTQRRTESGRPIVLSVPASVSASRTPSAAAASMMVAGVIAPPRFRQRKPAWGWGCRECLAHHRRHRRRPSPQHHGDGWKQWVNDGRHHRRRLHSL